MRGFVEKDVCIGCTNCTGVCPEVFSMDDDGKAVAISEEIPGEQEESAIDARDQCPVSAINIEE